MTPFESKGKRKTSAPFESKVKRQLQQLQEKLQEYINEYKEDNFSEFVFSWYVKEGKQSRLLAATGQSKELGR